MDILKSSTQHIKW